MLEMNEMLWQRKMPGIDNRVITLAQTVRGDKCWEVEVAAQRGRRCVLCVCVPGRLDIERHNALWRRATVDASLNW